MGYIFATAIAMWAAGAQAGPSDHIPNFDLTTMRSMSVVSGHCLKATRIAGRTGIRRRARCGGAYVLFGGPTLYGDVTIFFAAPDHARARGMAVMGTMKDARTLEIQGYGWGKQALHVAAGACRATSARGFDPPPLPRNGNKYAPLSPEEVASGMDDAGTPEKPRRRLDITCHVTDSRTGLAIADIAFRERRGQRHR